MVEPGATVSQTLRAEFSEEAMNVLDKTPEEVGIFSGVDHSAIP